MISNLHIIFYFVGGRFYSRDIKNIVYKLPKRRMHYHILTKIFNNSEDPYVPQRFKTLFLGKKAQYYEPYLKMMIVHRKTLFHFHSQIDYLIFIDTNQH